MPTVWLGHFSAPVIIGVGFFLLGIVLMLAMRAYDSTFWRRQPEVAPARLAPRSHRRRARGRLPPQL